MYKTLDDVTRVIELKKSDSVIDKFVASYLLGVALQPYFDTESKYEILVNTKDKETKEAIYDEDTEELLVEAIDYNQIRDNHIAELVSLYPYLVEPEVEYIEKIIEFIDPETQELVTTIQLQKLPTPTLDERRPVVEVDVSLWKLQNYVQLRKKDYPDYLEFFDAWVQDDIERLEKYKDDCLAIKIKYPKE